MPATLASGPGQYDGIEVLGDGRVLVSSWADGTINVIQNGTLSKLIGDVVNQAYEHRNMSAILTLGITMALLFVVRGFATYGHSVILTRIAWVSTRSISSGWCSSMNP